MTGKNNMKRVLNFEVVAKNDNAMCIEDAERFAKENGGRLPDQVEAMLILSESQFPELSKDNYGYWCKFRPYYTHGYETGYGQFHAGDVSTMDANVMRMSQFWCGVIVIKDEV